MGNDSRKFEYEIVVVARSASQGRVVESARKTRLLPGEAKSE